MFSPLPRRRFLKQSGAVAITAAVSAELSATAVIAASDASLQPNRHVLAMNRGWSYHPVATPQARETAFDDSGFAKVCLPHTNKLLPWHSFDEKESQFVSIYRRSIHLPAEAQGKRVFLDFEGVMVATTVYVNGQRIGSYKGGYTPFSFELTDHLEDHGKNVIAVEVDSSERKEIPPFGNQLDYLTFGGMYREVSLRIVPQISIANIFAIPNGVLGSSPSVEVRCFLDAAKIMRGRFRVKAELRDGSKLVATATGPAATPRPKPFPNSDAGQSSGTLPFSQEDLPHATVTLTNLGSIDLWELESPKLYTVHVQLLDGRKVIDALETRIGFRQAAFTPQGFSLNGKIVKLRGLDRHQTFPWVGQAMPARVQRRDAQILRSDFKCNIVRTSHYPQSRHFLDACDELGLLVLEEIPGWQHIGDKPWQDISVDNVRRMIQRDWNHPSVILWGVRINESHDNHDFYTRTNALAHALDPSRQTGGIRYLYETELLEDVMTMNDFGWPLRAPNHPRYLNTEFVGHTFPTKTIDSLERLKEHTHRHARVHDQLASNPQYAGGIGWCAFDYNTHGNFGSGDHICYHGVFDIFRTPKPAAFLYKSMCDPGEEAVLEMAHHWARNDESSEITEAIILTNCEEVKAYLVNATGKHPLAGQEDRKTYPHLPHPPFSFPLHTQLDTWGDLYVEGYVRGEKVVERRWSGKGVDAKFVVLADDMTLVANGADATRVVLRVEDEFGNIRPFAADAVAFRLEGAAEILGDNPFSLIGGTGAIWIRAGEAPGTVTLRATHPVLGSQEVHFELTEASPEIV